MTDGVGMPKRNVRGMIGAQTGATNRHASDQPKILIFVIAGTRRGEKNKRQPALIAENKHFKLAAQIWRVPFDVSSFIGSRASSWLRTRKIASPRLALHLIFAKHLVSDAEKHAHRQYQTASRFSL